MKPVPTTLVLMLAQMKAWLATTAAQATTR